MNIFDITIIKKRYSNFGSGLYKSACSICGGYTSRMLKDITTDDVVYVCMRCPDPQEDIVLPYPVRAETRRNLKNAFGLAQNNYFDKPTLTGKFFEGLSGHPARKERVDFSGHVVYMTLERAKLEGIQT